MKSAIEKKEDALKTARETLFSKINQAYDERKTALLNAWTIENQKERQRAVRVAWDNFRNSVKSANLNTKKHITKLGIPLLKMDKLVNLDQLEKIQELI
jgi:predicted nucleotide-binding protein (sugar kinase/HSP70/actin superfamily)